jgi:hypothetical protein
MAMVNAYQSLKDLIENPTNPTYEVFFSTQAIVIDYFLLNIQKNYNFVDFSAYLLMQLFVHSSRVDSQ